MSNPVVVPDLPGTSVTISGDGETGVPQGFGSVVMLPMVTNWGPMGTELSELQTFLTMPAVDQVYGGQDTPGRLAVAEAMIGQGVPSGRGAGGVIPWRMGTPAAAVATRTLLNTAGSPVSALKIDGLYKGTLGNGIQLVIESDPLVVANDRMRVLLSGGEVERFSYLKTDITALHDAVNARPSKWVKAASTPVVTGVALAHGTFALSGGLNGDVVTSTEWLAALDALEWAESGIIVPYDLTDASIKASILSWVQTMRDEMRPVRAVFGGGDNETVDAAIAEVANLRDPHLVRFGVGNYYDAIMDKTLTTSQLAPRIAGILAARGMKSALTRSLLGGLSAVGGSGPSADALKLGRDQGVTMARRVAHPDAQLAISQGVTTYNADTPAMPQDLWGEPRIIGLFDYIIRTMVAWGDDVIVGDTVVNDDTRAEVRKEVGKLLSGLEKDGLSKPGTSWVVCEDPEDPALAAAIPYTFGLEPTRTTNNLIGNGKVK